MRGGIRFLELNEAPLAIEAILFVSGEPVSVPELAEALGLSEMETMHAVEALQREYESGSRGIALRR